MHLLSGSVGQHWIPFALGVLAGLVTVLLFKQLNRRKEQR